MKIAFAAATLAVLLDLAGCAVAAVPASSNSPCAVEASSACQTYRYANAP